MNYRQALDYIYSFTDLERRTGYTIGEFTLNRIEGLLALLDNPHLGFPSVHVAGTKGKGSTAAMIASILQTAGYHTGLYTSPHLHTFRERIRVDGRLISPEEVAFFTDLLRPRLEELDESPSTFEVTTALAFLYFSRRDVDIAVLEVGLGGRLDATNVVNPLVSVITSLSFDHTAILGNTLAQIAWEKAGIIKERGRVICAPQPQEALEVIENVCRDKGAELFLVGREWRWGRKEGSRDGQSFWVESFLEAGKPRRYDDLWIPLAGRHQLINAAMAVGAVELLRLRGMDIPTWAIYRGLAEVQWPGRLEVISHRPLVVVDGAHNVDSARRLVEAIEEDFPHERLVLVFGASTDKDIPGMLKELLPLAQQVIVTRARHPRAAEPSLLAEEVRRRGREPILAEDVPQAIGKALSLAWGAKDLVLVTGSLFLVAEAREMFEKSVEKD